MRAKPPKPSKLPTPRTDGPVVAQPLAARHKGPKEKTEKQYAEATRLFKLVIERHPNTPWADLAQEELNRGFSVQRDEWSTEARPPPISGARQARPQVLTRPIRTGGAGHHDPTPLGPRPIAWRSKGRLDRLKGPVERNRLGQFATPPALALAVAEHAAGLRTNRKPRSIPRPLRLAPAPSSPRPARIFPDH